MKKLCEIRRYLVVGRVELFSDKPIFNKVQMRFLINIFLCYQFNLEPKITAEGGISGDDVSLINSPDAEIGLRKEIKYQPVSIREKQILSFYADALNQMFIEGAPGNIIPAYLWFDQKHENDTHRRIEQFRSAFIKYSSESLYSSVRRYRTKFPEKIKYFLNHLYGDELLPIKERGYYLYLKDMINKTFTEI